MKEINLAACVELIHSATLHDDVIDESAFCGLGVLILLVTILSRCFEIVADDGDLGRHYLFQQILVGSFVITTQR